MDVVVSIFALVVASFCMIAIFFAGYKDMCRNKMPARRYSRTDPPKREPGHS